jgi:hypothetical protein
MAWLLLAEWTKIPMKKDRCKNLPHLNMRLFQLGTKTSEINTLSEQYLDSEALSLLVLLSSQQLSEKLV